MAVKLKKSFYQNPDTISLAKSLLGKYLITNIGGVKTGGMITEVESYLGREDRASHAFGGRFTKRTEVMYAPGGLSYVYLCYGIHYLFNIVTHGEGEPHAILIRAMKPTIGLQTMLARRGHKQPLSSGPGTLTQSLGITLEHNGIDLTSNTIWLEDHHVVVSPSQIQISPRIGVSYAKEWAHKPLRFFLNS